MAPSPHLAAVLRFLAEATPEQGKRETDVYLKLLADFPDLEGDGDSDSIGDFLQEVIARNFVRVWAPQAEHPSMRSMCLTSYGKMVLARLPSQENATAQSE